MENNTKEPTLEEYGLDISSYKKYKEKINGLLKIRESLEFSWWKMLLVISLPIFLIFSFFAPNASIWIALFVSLFPFVWFNDLEKSFNNRNEEYQKNEKQIELLKQQSNVGLFEKAASVYFSKEVDDFYKYRVHRKRYGGNRQEGTYIEMLSEVSKIWQIFYGYQYQNAYYLLKNEKDRRFFVREHTVNRFNFSNLYGIKTKEKKEEIKPEITTASNVENEPLAQKQKIDAGNMEQASSDVSVFNQKVNTSEFYKRTPQERDSINGANDKLTKKVDEQIGKEIIIPEEEMVPVVPPEKRYRTARKIDNWEEINRKRKITGTKGEEIALAIEQEYFESIGRKDLADRVRHVSVEDGDGLGYDILSFFDNGKEKYIEVKSTTVSIGSPFNISANELGFLREHMDNSFVCRVLVPRDSADGIPGYEMVPSYVVLDHDISPTSFIVKPRKTENKTGGERSFWSRAFFGLGIINKQK